MVKDGVCGEDFRRDWWAVTLMMYCAIRLVPTPTTPNPGYPMKTFNRSTCFSKVFFFFFFNCWCFTLIYFLFFPQHPSLFQSKPICTLSHCWLLFSSLRSFNISVIFPFLCFRSAILHQFKQELLKYVQHQSLSL